MPRFEAKVDRNPERESDTLTTLVDNETGSRVVIASRALSIEAMEFGINGTIVPMIYGHADFAAFKRGLPRERRDLGLEPSLKAEANALRVERPTWAGAAWLDIANRVHEGKVKCVDPINGTTYWEGQFPVTHSGSNSYLHGSSTTLDAELINARGSKPGDTNANAEFYMPMTYIINGAKITIPSIHTFQLKENQLRKWIAIHNTSDYPLPIACGEHASYRIGSQGLEDHRILLLHSIGTLNTNPDRNPTGEITYLDENDPLRRRYQKVSEQDIDTTYVLEKEAEIDILNKKTGYGLEVRVIDQNTTMVTLWNHALPMELGVKNQGMNTEPYRGQFIAVEPIVSHGASLSLPAHGIRPNVNLKQKMLLPGEEMGLIRIYKPFVMQ